MKKYEIEAEGLPEGWKPVAFRKPMKGEYFWDGDESNEAQFDFEQGLYLIVEKVKPRRIILEETDEVRQAVPGEWWMSSDSASIYKNTHDIKTTLNYRIWREVKEEEPCKTK